MWSSGADDVARGLVADGAGAADLDGVGSVADERVGRAGRGAADGIVRGVVDQDSELVRQRRAASLPPADAVADDEVAGGGRFEDGQPGGGRAGDQIPLAGGGPADDVARRGVEDDPVGG